MAFCEGIAILGVVVGLLGVFTDSRTAPADGLLAAGPAVAGAIVGLGVVARSRHTADPRLVFQAATYIIGLANLGIVVAVLAALVGGAGRKHPIDGPIFAILGLVSLGSALALGSNGAQAIMLIEGVDEATARAISSKWIVRSALIQLVGVGTSIVAIALVLAR